MMRLAITLLFLCSDFAWGLGGSKIPEGSGRGQNRQCRVYDIGHEEHGNHFSCHECFKSGHGKCVERCYTYNYSCTAKGFYADGEEVTYNATGPNRTRVRNRAIDRCYNSGVPSCYIVACNERPILESSAICSGNYRRRREHHRGGKMLEIVNTEFNL